MTQLAPHQARRANGSLTIIDTSRRHADTALAEGNLGDLVTQLTQIAHEATSALAELARPPRSLRDKADKS